MYKVNGTYNAKIEGDLDIFSSECEEEIAGKVERWREVAIHGNPAGLRSLAALLLQIADADQEAERWPDGAREHINLQPDSQLSASSDPVIIGRLDAKGSGIYYGRFVQRKLP